MTFFLITSWAEGQLEQIAKKKMFKVNEFVFSVIQNE